MSKYISDLLVASNIYYARSYVQLFEEVLDQQIRSIQNTGLTLMQEEFWKNESKRTLRYSFFLRYYALFESHLTLICDRIKENENLSLSINEIKADSFLKCFEKYFTKVAGLSSPTNIKSWKEILVYSQIRNIIIHRNGVVKDINSYHLLSEYISRSKVVHIDRRKRINLRKRFAFRVLSHMSKFIFDLETSK
jgi:hypothetical protein